MSRPPPQPIFVHRGLEGGATSCAVVSTTNCAGILVGTGKGRCELYDADTHMHIKTVYVDQEERTISSVGELGNSIWLHVRNYAVIILNSDGVPQVSLDTSHCGYCKTITIDEWLVYPDTKLERHYLRFWSANAKGQNVALKNLPLSIVTVEETIFMGDEAGTLQRISNRGQIQKEVSLFSEPIFCLAATSSMVACGSAKPPIVLLSSDDIEGSRTNVNYPPCSRGVGSMMFSTSGKTLMAGFWDGSIRAFSVKKLTILLYLDLHSETISQMIWTEMNGEDRLIVASMDEKLSLWKLK
ncbi:hypothetical protein V3C99_015852 [Haemonchus contortus]|uniref:WD_REPEATS_REGION domain-containing protein n=1 Tax=Haemonchus contortus TaxID=6289 RepID=A0A7I4YX18_HAECO